VPVAAGTALLCVYGAANRDERQFERPEEVDCQRDNLKKHVSFGRGPHACVGSLLARTEGRIAVERLLGRLSSIEVVAPPGAGDFTRSYMLRGKHALGLRVD
jgi:cytochrome P450